MKICIRLAAIRLAIIAALACSAALAGEKIDRKAAVGRHAIKYSGYDVRLSDSDSPTQVGNGKFAFAFDRTGLQTLAPQNTLSDWGWHSTPPPDDPSKFKGNSAHSPARKIKFADSLPDPDNPELSQWLAANPHRLNLGRISFAIFGADGGRLDAGSIVPQWQTVDMYTGRVESVFRAPAGGARVSTVSHPDRDLVSARIKSGLLETGALRVIFKFPYSDRETSNLSGNWNAPEKHATSVEKSGDGFALLARELDGTRYFAAVKFSKGAKFSPTGNPHEFELRANSGELEFSCEFSPEKIDLASVPGFGESRNAYEKMWSGFWENGAFVDLSGSSDIRWKELERRIITSQYLMRINGAGLLPPQESGLRENSWFGRFHFEMIWWHAYHWLLWNRPGLADGMLSIYQKTLPYAREIARGEGYRGARWPKCLGDIPREWPYPIHAFLIWQQPHPIFFAEAEYRANPSEETLKKWADIVFATAEFMADLPIRDETGRYNLEPPLYIVSENTDPHKTRNPAFELGYWRYGLAAALEWQKRMGIAENKKWREVLENLAPLPQKNGAYEIFEGVENMWEKLNYEHPALIGTFGMLRGDGTDPSAIRRTLDKIDASWNFDRVWGWDFPMLAMAAMRVGDPERAIGYLLFSSPHYSWDEAGAVNSPCAYFPANGGLLAAVAMLANGWDGAPPPDPDALHFPKNGKWKVRAEGFGQKHQ